MKWEGAVELWMMCYSKDEGVEELSVLQHGLWHEEEVVGEKDALHEE